MMRNFDVKKIGLLALVLLLMSGCSLPVASARSGNPRAWIDKPLDSANLPLGPVEVISHGSDTDGVTEMVLLVNGEQVRVDAATQDGRLSTFSQLWEPAEAGTYTLQVLARNGQGGEYTSQSVIVVIGGNPPVKEEQTQVPTATSTPTEEGPTVTPSVTLEAAQEACTDKINFAGETIPDDTSFQPGTAFTKSWTLVNAGTCTWTTDYALTFIGGQRMGAPASVKLPQSVEPGGSIPFNVEMTAPTSAGEYLGTWMLSNEEGQNFGLGDDADIAFWAKIIVQSPTATPTSTTPAPSAPNAPSILQITSSVCNGSGLAVTLSWSDNADNEDGFRIYRDGGLIQTVGANVTTYNDNAPHKNSAYTYAVEAYNGVGASAQTTVNSQVCPVP